jgi:hypothetical protein
MVVVTGGQFSSVSFSNEVRVPKVVLVSTLCHCVLPGMQMWGMTLDDDAIPIWTQFASMPDARWVNVVVVLPTAPCEQMLFPNSGGHSCAVFEDFLFIVGGYKVEPPFLMLAIRTDSLLDSSAWSYVSLHRLAWFLTRSPVSLTRVPHCCDTVRSFWNKLTIWGAVGAAVRAAVACRRPSAGAAALCFLFLKSLTVCSLHPSDPPYRTPLMKVACSCCGPTLPRRCGTRGLSR